MNENRLPGEKHRTSTHLLHKVVLTASCYEKELQSHYIGNMQLFPRQALIRVSQVIVYAASSRGNQMLMVLM